MILIRTSHIAFYSSIVTLTVAVVMGFGFWFIHQQMLAGNDFLLNAESEEIIPRLVQIPSPITHEKVESALLEHTKVDEPMFYFQVHEPAGKVIFQSANLGAQSLADLTGGPDKRTIKISPLGLLRVAEYHTPRLHVQIAMSLRNFQSVNVTFKHVFLIGIPLIAALSVALGVSLRKSTLRPVRLMQATAQRISASNLSERIPVPRGRDEMASLARLLNDMIDRLEKSFSHVKRFTADMSHELMTPLSVIRLHAEKLLNDPQLPVKYRSAVEEQLQETLLLTETLERLLMLAKADSTVLPLKLQPVNIHEYVGQFAEDAQLLAESREMKAVVIHNDTGTACFDQNWIRQVLFNLLSNALRFSPPNGTITIDSKFTEGNWVLEVGDEGPGVPEHQLNNIFERFYQITPNSGTGSGAGLGLAICKSIVELHKGRIWAGNRTDRSGLRVAFSLPLDGLRG